MVEKKTDNQKTTTKKVATKSATTKKVATKKVATKKSTSNNTAAASDAPSQNGVETLSTIKTLIDEMRQENINRDKQTASLVQEIRQGFSSYSEHATKQESEREQEMTKLYQSLQTAFTKVEDTGNDREDRSLLILKALSDSIMKDHEQTLKEVLEQEKLQDKKFQHLTQVEDRRAGRNRWIAIPGMIIGITAIIYMFHVVNVMDVAMTSMSKDMNKMQFSVANMSEKMDGMSQDTSSMSTDMKKLNQNMGQMSRDLNIMTYNVSPTMKGLRDMMPWAP